eukprot:CAMPEP_0184498412 /NCGR_PEP_ID=MMETSP0113_2-20130426/38898_1 /TAXON_ID=91329 /ORGANISM="Norrisiella sphaerica, Strain BC52" /LENGTH=305 /DNA_ID=CAMNT_0026885907 /DNA_START=945 /DNA_END=1863 /DNA_ORIENTATION=+
MTEDTICAMKELAKSSFVCSIGETGLDFNRMHSPKDKQIEAFRLQVNLAVELKLPLFIHERDAHEDLVKVLDGFQNVGLPPVCIHCFTGSEDVLRYYVSQGYYIGITGYVAKKRGEGLRQMIQKKILPLEQAMVETDSPYMCPDHSDCKPYMRRNEPCTLGIVAQTLAECYEVPVEVLAEQTTRNARKFFNLPEIPAPSVISPPSLIWNGRGQEQEQTKLTGRQRLSRGRGNRGGGRASTPGRAGRSSALVEEEWLPVLGGGGMAGEDCRAPTLETIVLRATRRPHEAGSDEFSDQKPHAAPIYE